MKMKMKMKKLQKGKGIAEDLYSDSASFGQFMAKVSLIICSIIFIILLIVGIKLLFKKNIYTESVTAIIKTADCSTYNNNGSIKTRCNLLIEYKNPSISKEGIVNSEDTLIKSIISDTNKLYNKGESVIVYYDPKNPHTVVLTKNNWRLIGIILISIGVFILLISLINYYIVHRFKFAAAASGVNTVI